MIGILVLLALSGALMWWAVQGNSRCVYCGDPEGHRPGCVCEKDDEYDPG